MRRAADRDIRRNRCPRIQTAAVGQRRRCVGCLIDEREIATLAVEDQTARRRHITASGDVECAADPNAAAEIDRPRRRAKARTDRREIIGRNLEADAAAIPKRTAAIHTPLGIIVDPQTRGRKCAGHDDVERVQGTWIGRVEEGDVVAIAIAVKPGSERRARRNRQAARRLSGRGGADHAGTGRNIAVEPDRPAGRYGKRSAGSQFHIRHARDPQGIRRLQCERGRARERHGTMC
ncbi:hypothetical protein D9M73_112510 [compost metagenome]